MIDSIVDLLRGNKRLAVGVGIALLVLVVAYLSFGTGNSPKGTPLQTGGNYSPDETIVVFHDSNNLYDQLRSSELDALRAQLAKIAEEKYGKGTHKVYVVGDKLNYTNTEDGVPPSFWFEVAFDGRSDTIRVDVDMSSGNAVFAIE